MSDMAHEQTIPAVVKATWQAALFASQPRRRDLLALQPSWPCQAITLRVHRNMPFEYIAGALPAFLAYADITAQITLGDYDDSLNFQLQGAADCELVWLDFTRYRGKLSDEALVLWFGERLRALRERSAAPILLADGGGAGVTLNHMLAAAVASIPACRIFPRQILETRLGDSWSDLRMKEISASSMSDAANLLVAQALGLVWLPGALRVGLKAIVLDLDHTLYTGVLGEDGPEGLKLTPAHRILQEKLRTLKQQGLFLAVLSRNNYADAVQLFQQRTDFPLRWEDFAAVSISWQEKHLGLRLLATQLRIHKDAMIILDDNLGEIAQLAQHFPQTSLYYAADPENTVKALELLPGLLRWHHDRTDQLRTDDLKAAQQRQEALAQAPDTQAYMRSLELQLQCHLDPHALLGRLADLSHKTNQFNLALRRLSEPEVARRLDDPQAATIAIALSDKLSDSGVIAAIFCHAETGLLVVDDLCISCRALGRGIEDTLVVTALACAAAKLHTKDVAFTYDLGPRNAPARDWLAQFGGQPLTDERGRLLVPEAKFKDQKCDLPVRIIWNGKENAA